MVFAKSKLLPYSRHTFVFLAHLSPGWLRKNLSYPEWEAGPVRSLCSTLEMRRCGLNETELENERSEGNDGLAWTF